MSRTSLEQWVGRLLDYLAVTDPSEPADVIWGLGSNEPRVAEKAVALYGAGLAPWLVFSGGRGHRWPDLPEAEADMFAGAALARGVPAERIVVENQSTNTAENVTLTLPLLDNLGIDVRTALLVTIPPFQRRAALTVRTHRQGIRCINQPIDWGSLQALSDRAFSEVAGLCAGEITRLQDYPRRGFIDFDPSSIPRPVREAASAVRQAIAPS